MISYKYKNYIFIIAILACAMCLWESLGALSIVAKAIDHGQRFEYYMLNIATVFDFIPALLFVLFLWKSAADIRFRKFVMLALIAQIVVDLIFSCSVFLSTRLFGGEYVISTQGKLRYALLAVSVYCAAKPSRTAMKILGAVTAVIAAMNITTVVDMIDYGSEISVLFYYVGNLLLYSSIAFFAFTNVIPSAADYAPAPAAGFTYAAPAAYTAPPVFSTAAESLTTLKSLYDSGAITEEEYLSRRSEIISKL